MTRTKPPIGFDPSTQGTTAASGFHLSETIDWSSHAAQVKNQVILLPVQTRPQRRIDAIEHGSTNQEGRKRSRAIRLKGLAPARIAADLPVLAAIAASQPVRRHVAQLHERPR